MDDALSPTPVLPAPQHVPEPFLPVEAYVPHRGAMCLIHRLLEADADHAVTEVLVPADGLFVRESAAGAAVPAWVGLEYMAQTISAWSGARSRREGSEPRLGFLLGSRRMQTSVAEFACGTRLRVEAHHEFVSDNGLGMFDCRILQDGVEVATARLSIYEPADGAAFLNQGTSA